MGDERVDKVEVCGDSDRGCSIEYSYRIGEFDSGKELISFYNDRIRDKLNREPLSVAGDASEEIK